MVDSGHLALIVEAMPRENEPAKSGRPLLHRIIPVLGDFSGEGGVEKVQRKCKTQKCRIFEELDKSLWERVQPIGVEPITF